MTITPSCDVTISGVTIQHGHALTGTLGGGGIKNVGTLSLSDAVVQHNTVQGSGAADSGGGIHNIGTLLLNNVTIFSNTANHGGGGIRSNGPLTITNSTLASNTANVAGGGLLVSGPSTATLENVTISGNNAGNGGGLRNDGHITLNSCTLAGNWTAGTGLGRAIQNSLVITLANTIVSSTMPSDNCAGTAVTSNGHNLDGGDSCGLGSTGDITDTNPLLGPLQDNGGSTLTHALLDGSPAIGRGDDARCPPTDQRGVFRIGTCDIGAYEVARWTHLPLLLRSY
jgi:predicted outer membrane repeat protein